jgi:hypothetical protein
MNLWAHPLHKREKDEGTVEERELCGEIGK